jgi:hypothetical protein
MSSRSNTATMATHRSSSPATLHNAHTFPGKSSVPPSLSGPHGLPDRQPPLCSIVTHTPSSLVRACGLRTRAEIPHTTPPSYFALVIAFLSGLGCPVPAVCVCVCCSPYPQPAIRRHHQPLRHFGLVRRPCLLAGMFWLDGRCAGAGVGVGYVTESLVPCSLLGGAGL